MKKKVIIIFASALLLLSAIFSSCSLSNFSNAQKQRSSDTQASGTNQETIKELEAKLKALLKDQQNTETKNQKEIENLKAEIEKLKEKSSNTQKASDIKSTEKDENIFKYTVNNGVATITEIHTKEKNIVIPYTIDGYKVYCIGSEALSSASVESIIVSSGIEKLDWFAFKNCTSLVSVSLPDTVSSIGYGAFDNVSKSFVLRCSKNSFAHRYAQSYGITYDLD